MGCHSSKDLLVEHALPRSLVDAIASVDDSKSDDSHSDDSDVDASNVDDSSIDVCDVDGSNVDDSTVDDSNVDGSDVDVSDVDVPNVDDSNADVLDAVISDVESTIEKVLKEKKKEKRVEKRKNRGDTKKQQKREAVDTKQVEKPERKPSGQELEVPSGTLADPLASEASKLADGPEDAAATKAALEETKSFEAIDELKSAVGRSNPAKPSDREDLKSVQEMTKTAAPAASMAKATSTAREGRKQRGMCC